MPIRRTLKNKLSQMGKTFKKQGRYLTKAYQINKIISELKETDISHWRERWENNGEYVDEEGVTQREEGVGVRFQNLSSYLKRKKSEMSNIQYRLRANRIIEQREHDIRWRIIAARAHQRNAEQRRLESRTYEPGVEQRLATMGLSQAQIEQNPDPAVRVDLYDRRLLEAPVVRLAILADADREHEAMMARVRDREHASPATLEEGYDSEEGWGTKKKRKANQKKSKRKKHRRQKTKKYRKQ